MSLPFSSCSNPALTDSARLLGSFTKAFHVWQSISSGAEMYGIAGPGQTSTSLGVLQDIISACKWHSVFVNVVEQQSQRRAREQRSTRLEVRRRRWRCSRAAWPCAAS